MDNTLCNIKNISCYERRIFMNYKEFETELKTALEEYLGSEITLNPVKSVKNNGVIYHGLVFQNKASNIAPTIYLDDFYEKYTRGFPFSKTVHEVLRLYKQSPTVPDINGKQFLSFEANKDKITYRLINYELNQSSLENRPYIPYLDLAITFDIILKADSNGIASLPIKYELLELWGKSVEEIYDLAKRNTERLFPVQIQTMDTLLKDIMLDDKLSENDRPNLLILSNDLTQYGANCMLYRDILKSIGDNLQENFYILPSSIHEVLILGENHADALALSDMIQDINEAVVLNEEILSDHPYYYDRNTMSVRYAE